MMQCTWYTGTALECQCVHQGSGRGVVFPSTGDVLGLVINTFVVLFELHAAQLGIGTIRSTTAIGQPRASTAAAMRGKMAGGTFYLFFRFVIFAV